MRIVLVFLLLFSFISAQKKTLSMSEETQECIDCHQMVSPGIVMDWKKSLHSKTSPEKALKKDPLSRRVSSTNIPEKYRNVVVGCYECHSQNPKAHKDTFEHFDFKIHVIVTPNDCKACHGEEVQQYSHSKKAHAVDNLDKNPFYHKLIHSIIGKKELKKGKLVTKNPSKHTRNETCFGCHGTRIEVKGMKTIFHEEYEEIQVPNLIGWPNHGVGRINPDGSLGACTSCHPRHTFSIEVARKPYTCAQCHLAPDVPAWEVYKESKHGNIFLSTSGNWNWKKVPWVLGKDFGAPTCASCHNSLITDGEKNVIIKRTHNFGDRLWYRLFGLIYAHPQPKDGKTYLIKNQDGLSIPTTFDGKFASKYLIDEKEQKKRKKTMSKVCRGCHSSSYVNNHFAKMHSTIKETNEMTYTATKLMQSIWKTVPGNAIEKKWMQHWLFYANSVRYGSAMSGHDYATFQNGWWNMTKTIQELYEKAYPPKSQK